MENAQIEERQVSPAQFAYIENEDDDDGGNGQVALRLERIKIRVRDSCEAFHIRVIPNAASAGRVIGREATG